MLLFEFLILIPFFFGLYVGLNSVLRPASRPNFEAVFKKRYPRSEWNERNPEDFTRRLGWLVLAGTLAYGALILIPWLLR